MSLDLVLKVSPELIEVKSNVGVNRHADEALIASIRELGILQPLLVTKDEEHPHKYELVAGHRRFDAAKRLGLETVPALLRVGLSPDDGRLLASQIVENTVRSDLSAMEEVEAYEQLLLQVDVDEAARLVSKPVESIEKIKTLTESSVARDNLEGGLTLFQATDLAELEKNEFISGEQLQRCVDDIRNAPEQADFFIRRARRGAVANQRCSEKAAELEAAGVNVLFGDDAPAEWECVDEKFMKVSRLAGADGAEMTVGEHESCPGHVAVVSASFWDPEPDVFYVCEGYESHGHRLVTDGKEASVAEMRRAELVARASKRWRLESQDAAAARRRHVINRLADAKLPVSFARLILQAVYVDDRVLELLPGSADSVRAWISDSDDRAMRVAAAAAFLLMENHVGSKLMPGDTSRELIQALMATGHEPTPLEEKILADTFVLPSDRSDADLENE